ncbi:MAG: hypothetical protein E6Q89_03665 [Bacteroidia bacterium]|nr:MAG: hypothetical protein E6Q89_03665 [Bacteroidia bacterium]
MFNIAGMLSLSIRVFKLFFLLLILMCSHSVLMAQKTSDKRMMEEERRFLQQELQQIEATYNAVKGKTSEGLGQIAALQRKVELQNKYINNLGKEVRLIDDDIYYGQLEINRLRKQMDTLKAHYARSIVYAYKNRSSFNYLNFIFSAKSFNDALKRLSYLKSYTSYREQQLKDINNTKSLIETRKDLQESYRSKKKYTLNTRSEELIALEHQKIEKDSVVKSLQSNMGGLLQQIASKKKRDAELRSNISEVVRQEIAEARRIAQEEMKRQAAIELAKEREVLRNSRTTNTNVADPGDLSKVNTGNAKGISVDRGTGTKIDEKETKDADIAKNNPPTIPVPATPKKEVEAPKPVINKAPEGGYLNFRNSDVAINGSFAQNRGKLPYPIDNGIISLGFGRYKIEGIGPDVVGDNPGVTFSAPVGEAVKSIFEGEVASVSKIGTSYLVIIRHGKYFTAYSNLSSVSVSKGSAVSRGQSLGAVANDPETGTGKLDFILMVEDKNVNPLSWLKK